MEDAVVAGLLARIEMKANPREEMRLLAEYAPHLTERQLREVIRVIHYTDDHVATLLLSSLAPWIVTTAGLRCAVLRAVNLIVDLKQRMEVLRALKPHWKMHHGTEIESESNTRHLSSTEFDIKINGIRSITTLSDRAEAYSNFDGELDDNQLNAVLSEILEIEDESARTRALRGPSGFGPLLDQLGKRLPKKLLGALDTFQNDEMRATVIWSLPRVLPKDHLRETLLAAMEIKSDRFKALVLSEGGAGGKLLRAEPERSVALASSLKDESARAHALRDIAFNGPPSHLLKDILLAASTIRTEEDRAVVFAGLSRVWTEEQRLDALGTLNKIVDKRTLSEMFAAFGRPMVPLKGKTDVANNKSKRKSKEKIAQLRSELNSPPIKDIVLTASSDTLRTLGSRGLNNEDNNTGERTEGRLPNERRVASPKEGLEGLRSFLRAYAGDDLLDEHTLAEAALVAAKKRTAGRPIWDDRKRYENLRHLNAARFVRAVYSDLIEGGPDLPDGRSIWHLHLPGGYPVWQEAVRSYDPKTVQMLYVYVNGRGDNLGDAEGLIFAKKVNRPTAKKPKPRSSRSLKRFQLA